MIEGTVETLTDSGIFAGWLRDTDDRAPVIVELRHEGEVVAHAVAAAFRPDLLRSGHGHGHYGFQARLTAMLPPGPAMFNLHLPRHGQGVRARLTVPPLALSRAATVESLLLPEPAWTTADVLPHIACLGLAEQRKAMGSARFIDVAYRFALSRWPSKAELQVYQRALDEGGLRPDDLLAELLTSRERQDVGSALPSPWDAAFPFLSLPRKEAR